MIRALPVALLALCGSLPVVGQLLEERPAFETHFVSPFPGGGILVAGERTAMRADSSDPLRPLSGDWLSFQTPILDVDGRGNLAALICEDGMISILTQTHDLGDPLQAFLPDSAHAVAVGEDRVVSLATTRIHCWTIVDGEVTGSLIEPLSLEDGVVRQDLLYGLRNDSLFIHELVEELPLLWQGSLPGESALHLGSGTLFISSPVETRRYALDGNGMPLIPEAWEADPPPTDIHDLGDEYLLVTRPGIGLQRIHWPVSGIAQPLQGRPFSPDMGRISIVDDQHLLVAEAAQGCGLYRLQGTQDPAAQGRVSTRPLPIEWLADPAGEEPGWLLDGRLGWRRFGWHPDTGLLQETAVLPFPRSVIGGDIVGDWAGAVTRNAGLRFYELLPEGAEIRGVHSTDPVVDVAISPELLLAYVTASGFVAIKEINPFPYTILHHGTINLSCDPAKSFWNGNQFFLGSHDGRLFHVDASDVDNPALGVVHELPGAVLDADPFPPMAIDRWLVAAGSLCLLEVYGAGESAIGRQAAAPAGEVVAVSVRDRAAFATASPSAFGYFDGTIGNPLDSWETASTELCPPVHSLAQDAEGKALLVLEDGRLQRRDWNQVAAGEAPTQPGSLQLQVAPNPFNPQTRASFTLQHAGNVEVSLYDIRGALLQSQRLVLPAGSHRLPLSLEGAGSGLYLLRVSTDHASGTARLLYLR